MLARLLILLITSALLMACSDNNDNDEPQYLPISDLEVSAPPDIGAPLNLGRFDPAAAGYEETEFFVSGTATAFTNLSELGSDGFWEVEPAEEADYTTRVLVRRPADSADFNGTVLVEWMNVSAGFDSTPEWNNAKVEIIRRGYVWVGVTAQLVGVEGSPGGIIPFHLKAFNPERYAELEHPGDSFSYDIFSQVAQALRNPGDMDLLDGLVAERLIGAGESQSAFRMTTYVNAIHPLYNPYDGYLIHSRAAYATPLAQAPQTAIATPAEVFIRTDLNVPVLVFQAETDVVWPSLNSVLVRQEDTDSLRFWEVAGTAHADRYTLGAGDGDIGTDPSVASVAELDNVQGAITCDSPFNSGPMHYVFNTALAGMNNWIINGEAPPAGNILETTDDLTGFILDDLGNVRGGIRTAYVDAPVAILSGLGQTGGSFCSLFGTTVLFTPAELFSLYGSQQGYVDAVITATEEAFELGFLLREDADQIIEWAPQQWQIQTAE